MKEIYSAFIRAKRAFGPALKDKNNPAFKRKYADLGACIESVEDALLANGIAFIQETFEDSSGVTVETVFLHESGEALRCGKLHVPASKQDPQGYGSALTYARRYSLMAACGIAPEDDDGNAAVKAKQAEAARRAQEEADRLKPIRDLAALMIDDFNNSREGWEWRAFEEASQLDNDGKNALWTELKEFSKIRSTIKRLGQEQRERDAQLEKMPAATEAIG